MELLTSAAGAAGADAVITSIAVNTTSASSVQLARLVNMSLTAAELLASASSVSSTVFEVDADDPGPMLNGDAGMVMQGRRRMQQQQQSGYVPLDIATPGTTIVSISTVTMKLVLPASLLASSGGDAAASVAALRAQLVALLSSRTSVQRALGGFLRVWADCTGLPPTTAAVMPRSPASYVQVIAVCPSNGTDTGLGSLSAAALEQTLTPGAAIGIIIGSIAAVVLCLLLSLCLIGGCGRRVVRAICCCQCSRTSPGGRWDASSAQTQAQAEAQMQPQAPKQATLV